MIGLLLKCLSEHVIVGTHIHIIHVYTSSSFLLSINTVGLRCTQLGQDSSASIYIY